ncbi:MAG: Hsp20/alpha crystallin family protein [Candidatus Hydrogenedentes bacterium]|nr:Hsp20/alpha crystallin family protein [Candidatus Hydrogenedentota bacterium]
MSELNDEKIVEQQERKSFKSSRLMSAAVALLAVAVCVQGYYLYSMHGRLSKADAADKNGYQFIGDLQKSGPNSTPPLNSSGSSLPSLDPFFSWSPFGPGNSDPFQHMNQLRQQMDQLFNQAFGSTPPGFGTNLGGGAIDMTFSPKVDMTEDADSYIITIDAPGTDKSNLDVKLEDRTLTISGKRDGTIAKQDGGKVIRQERVSGEFQRAIVLPGPVQEGSMTAKYDNGVLRVTIKKANEPKVRDHIQVQ